jgi:hypothetical protein
MGLSAPLNATHEEGLEWQLHPQNGFVQAQLKTTEFWAMVGVIGAILVATWVSDSLNDVRAWTLIAAVAIGYMISRGLAQVGHQVRRQRRPAQSRQR